MQSLNPHNAKTYDYMRRSDEVADRILNKSKQLLAKTWDKKCPRSAGSGKRLTNKSAAGTSRREGHTVLRSEFPVRGSVPFLQQVNDDVAHLNPDLYR